MEGLTNRAHTDDSEEELDLVKSFLQKFKSTRHANLAYGDAQFDDGAAEEMEDVEMGYHATGLKYMDQLVRLFVPSFLKSQRD